MRTPRGNLIGAKVSPSFVQRYFTLPFQRVIPLEVRVYWECQQEVGNKSENKLYFTLEAKDNLIVFNAITDKLRVNYLLSNFLEIAKFHSKDKKIDICEIIDPLPKLPSIVKSGLRDWIRRRITEKPHEKIKKTATEIAILPSLVLSIVIIENIKSWLLETIVEKITNTPFILFEILVCATIILIFYGGDRVKNYFFKIPPKYATAVIKFFLGQSSEFIINSREYDEWRTGKAK